MTDEMMIREAAPATVDTEQRLVTGRLAVFDTPTRVADYAGGPAYTEVVARGALDHIDPATDRVGMYDRHRELIGRMVALDPSTADATFKVSRTSAGNDALELVRDGALWGLSWGASASESVSHTRSSDGAVVRTKLALREGSVTDQPAYVGAAVSHVREDNMQEEHDAPESVETVTPEPAAEEVTRSADTTGAITGQMQRVATDIIEELTERQRPAAEGVDPDNLFRNAHTPRALGLPSLRDFLGDMWDAHHTRGATARAASDRIDETWERAIADTASGDTAGAVPPIYLNDLIERVSTNAPLWRAMGAEALPDTGLVLHQPRTLQGTLVGPRAAETSENTSQQFTTEDVTSNIEMYSGANGITYEAANRTRPNMQDALIRDLMAAWLSRVDLAIINDDGTGNTIEGMLQVTGIGTTTAITTWNAANFWAAIWEAMGDVLAASNGAPVLLAVHSRRYAHIMALLNSTNNPLFATGTPQQNSFGTLSGTLTGGSPLGGPAQPMGTLGGVLPIVIDNNIPTNLGAGAEDIMMVISGDSFQPFVAADAPFQVQLTYAADFITNVSIGGLIGLQPRRPAAMVTIGGSALVA